MTRQPHDQFAKKFLQELLSPLGTVEVSREVTGETRQIDVFFSPNPRATDRITEIAEQLGLLGRIVTTTVLLEPFRNAPTRIEIRNCILKLFSLFAERERQTKREKQGFKEDNLPYLWILATSVSIPILESFGAKLERQNWTTGVYFLPASYRTAIVSINQLPVTSETLCLRLLGRGETQHQAVRELLTLPERDSFRRNVTELLLSWRVSVDIQNILQEEDREVFMALSQVYLEWKAKTEQEARQEGQRQIVENLLRVRFGQLDESLLQVIDGLLELPAAESSRLLLELSREDLLARFLLAP